MPLRSNIVEKEASIDKIGEVSTTITRNTPEKLYSDAEKSYHTACYIYLPNDYVNISLALIGLYYNKVILTIY